MLYGGVACFSANVHRQNTGLTERSSTLSTSTYDRSNAVTSSTAGAL
jgi:hypothetical protein